MRELNDARVSRSGITASFYRFETKKVRADAKGQLCFQFAIASKGGGFTDILLTIGEADIKVLLPELAASTPSLAPQFAEATHIALQNSGKNNAE